MQYRSRLKNRVKDTYYKNTVLSIAAIIVIVAVLLFFGLQLLINFSLLLGRIKSIGEVPGSTQNELVFPPTLDPLYEATFSATIKVSGVGSQPGQEIELYLNDDSVKTAIVDNDSRFVIADVRLETGENRIKAKASKDGKESDFSDEQMVVHETTPPALEVSEPTDGQTVKKTNQVRVVGKTDLDATVSINGFLPIVDSNGGFSYTMPLVDGENTITVTATDKAGNQTKNEIKVTFEP